MGRCGVVFVSNNNTAIAYKIREGGRGACRALRSGASVREVPPVRLLACYCVISGTGGLSNGGFVERRLVERRLLAQRLAER